MQRHLFSQSFAGPSAERFSRKRTIMMGSAVFIVGAALQCGANGYAMMVVGRAIAGLGIGTLSMTVPLYQVRPMQKVVN